MSTKLAGLKEQFLPSFAERFQAAGYAVLLYDHRNWGSSDGLPRSETDPIQQARDFSVAFDFVASLEEVDNAKIVYWGSSMSGGAVLYAAALDKRIRAVISQVPFVSGESISPLFAKIGPSIYAGRKQVKAGSAPALMKMFPETSEDMDPNTIMHDPNLIPSLKALEAENLSFSPSVTPQTLLHLFGFEPLAFVHRIAPTALFIVVADTDNTAGTSAQLKAFASAYEPKRMVLLEDSGHFDVYYGEGFEKNIKAQLNFLKEFCI